jgi:hypothetical protein
MSGASITQPGLDAAIAQAIADGFEVVRANDYTLLLDIDNEAALAQYGRVLPIVAEHFGAAEVERWPSKSGNTHIRLALAYPQPWALRYALEACLGSDGMRNSLACVQMNNGCDEASILFRPAMVAAPVEEDIKF